MAVGKQKTLESAALSKYPIPATLKLTAALVSIKQWSGDVHADLWAGERGGTKFCQIF